MRFAIICRDKADSLEIRMSNREAHLAFLATGPVEQAGPFLDTDGKMVGSMLIVDFDTLADAQSWAAKDPYANAGLFETVYIDQWKKVIG
ncbi:hypothetical protein BVG79_02284 [Ketogulonicigenium robustum]|uniref:YCII-related domain-containing protein n=1 Tax=Ketogulonicigenium robustum TaxID=92947 RepID=A0A1W6P2F3_9RHOB|nr:YciI family protein [Ketogulonicigenium robustum]ARO15624.1 hypothetical protein BVG79_02284 [Ketogulonicigenium robustum]